MWCSISITSNFLASFLFKITSKQFIVTKKETLTYFYFIYIWTLYLENNRNIEKLLESSYFITEEIRDFRDCRFRIRKCFENLLVCQII